MGGGWGWWWWKQQLKNSLSKSSVKGNIALNVAQRSCVFPKHERDTVATGLIIFPGTCKETLILWPLRQEGDDKRSSVCFVSKGKKPTHREWLAYFVSLINSALPSGSTAAESFREGLLYWCSSGTETRTRHACRPFGATCPQACHFVALLLACLPRRQLQQGPMGLWHGFGRGHLSPLQQYFPSHKWRLLLSNWLSNIRDAHNKLFVHILKISGSRCLFCFWIFHEPILSFYTEEVSLLWVSGLCFSIHVFWHSRTGFWMDHWALLLLNTVVVLILITILKHNACLILFLKKTYMLF